MEAASTDAREVIDGWLLTAAGPNLRSGVAAPVEFGSTAAGLGPALAWLTDHDLAPRLMVADRLLRSSALGAAPRASIAYEVLVGPEPDRDTPAGEWALISPGVAAATVPAFDGAARDAWRALGFELHHTCRLLTM